MEDLTENLQPSTPLEEASGNFKYITLDDLTEQSYERFIDESSKDNYDQLPSIEDKTIELVKSYIGSRYKVSEIFGETPVRNEILAELIATIVLYKLFKRNAARKINSQLTDDYNTAIAKLEKIATGRLPLDGLPSPTNEDGSAKKDTIYFNNSNRNFFI